MMADMGAILRSVGDKIKLAYQKRPPELGTREPRLVAVSKTKPKEAIVAAYQHGQTHFGENYVQEIVEKGNDPEILEKCPNIKWHFIGHLQRNKIGKLISIPNLYCVETVESEKLASSLDSAWAKLAQPERLEIMVQVNTSGEESKNGLEPCQVAHVVDFVLKSCPNLHLRGLMTIGAFDHDLTTGANPDFQRLIECRKQICEQFNFTTEDMELSMGMSHDFEHAVEMGSTNVRIGSTIFGDRVYPAK